jgi:valyl-tRNA synthetase
MRRFILGLTLGALLASGLTAYAQRSRDVFPPLYSPQWYRQQQHLQQQQQNELLDRQNQILENQRSDQYIQGLLKPC